MELTRNKKIFLFIVVFIAWFSWIESEQRFTVRGRVVDASTGEPIEGASVAIRWGGYHIAAIYSSGHYWIEKARTITDKDGYFEIPKYFMKEFDMGVYKKGYVCWSSDSIFLPGLNVERRELIKDKLFKHVHSGMVIELNRFNDEYDKFKHAFYVERISEYSGGLEGIGDEMLLYDQYMMKKN